MNIKFRKGFITDMNALSSVNKECLPIYYQPMEFMYFVLSPSFDIFIAYSSDNTIVGYLLGEFQDKNFHIMSIGVLKKYRENKIGTKLLDYCIQNIKNNHQTISLFVHTENTSAIKFYKKNKFIIVRTLKNYYEGSIPNTNVQDAYRMERII